DEHLQAITKLKQLEELIFMLDGDDAGKAATMKHGTALQALLPKIKVTTVELPEGEDVNSVLQAHDDPRVLADLIGSRKALSFTIATEQPVMLPNQKPGATPPGAAGL